MELSSSMNKYLIIVTSKDINHYGFILLYKMAVTEIEYDHMKNIPAIHVFVLHGAAAM